MKKKKYIYLGLLLFFLLIFFLSPIAGDDWGNFLVGNRGIYHSLGNALGMYFDWEGRLVSRVLINILTYHKWLWNIVNSIAITSIIYLTIKIINPKNKKMVLLLSILMILLMNLYTFSQVVTWVAGNITYLLVIPLMLFYFYEILFEKASTKFKRILFSVLNFIIPMFVEHTGVVLVAANLLLLGKYYYKHRKLNRELLEYTFISIIGLVFMLISPGSKKRSAIENLDFNELNFFEKMLFNVPNFIYYTFMINYYLTFLMALANFCFLKDKKIKIGLKIIGILFLSGIPIIITGAYLLSTLKPLSFLEFFTEKNILVELYFVIYLLVEFFLIGNQASEKKKDTALFFFVLGILANIVMLVSPTWGYRTSFASYIFLSLSYLSLLDDFMNENKVLNGIFAFMNILSILFYLIFYINISREYRDNLERIRLGKEEEREVIEILKYPHFAPCNINPENEYHLERFKEYYKIEESTKIKLIEGNWKYLIFYVGQEG